MQQVGGYRIVRELGRGGMGVVYQAVDPGLDRPVAIKLLLEAPTPDELARFQREALALAAVEHPAIVRVHAAGEDRGRPYLVMEFVDGEPLSHRLRREGRMPAALAVAWVGAVAHGVAAAHARGVLHRDIKPENVLLDADEQPKLTDFGLARLDRAQRLTQTGELLGTPQFMAPEQASGETDAISPAVDVYGLGALLHTLLAGEPPFVGPTVTNVLHRLLTEPPTPLPADVPPQLAALTRRCLEKDPALRPTSAAAFAEALDTAQNADVASVGRRVLVGLAGAAVVIAGIGVVSRRELAQPTPTPASTAAPPTTPTTPPAATPTTRASPTPTPSRIPPPSDALIDQRAATATSIQLTLASGDRHTALRLATQWVEQDPCLASHNCRADLLVQLNRWPRARTDLEQALRYAELEDPGPVAREPDMVPRLKRRLSVLYRRDPERRREALALADEALAASADVDAGWDVRAQARAALDDWEGALADWRHLERAFPTFQPGPVRVNQARALLVLERLDEALAKATESVEQARVPGRSLWLRGRIRHRLGDHAGALVDVEAALAEDASLAEEPAGQGFLRNVRKKAAALPDEVGPDR